MLKNQREEPGRMDFFASFHIWDSGVSSLKFTLDQHGGNHFKGNLIVEHARAGGSSETWVPLSEMVLVSLWHIWDPDILRPLKGE